MQRADFAAGPFERLKRLFVGRALRNEEAPHQRLSKKVALAGAGGGAARPVAVRARGDPAGPCGSGGIWTGGSLRISDSGFDRHFTAFSHRYDQLPPDYPGVSDWWRSIHCRKGKSWNPCGFDCRGVLTR